MIPSFGLFLITFTMVSITPGMCMILSLTMGMTVGHLRTLWMMLGELIGVAIVVFVCGLGAGTLMLEYHSVFIALKYLGGLYLLYLSIQLWLSKGSLSIPTDEKTQQNTRKTNYQLASQGLITAIINPKGWAFFIALLPPFLSPEQALVPQLIILISGILIIEFLSLNLYCYGGHFISKIIGKEKNVKILNRISGTLMAFVAVWLAFG
jgi:threonine/homoserine/homoserine lactone efflux protein